MRICVLSALTALFVLAACRPTQAPELPTLAPIPTSVPSPISFDQPVRGDLTLGERIVEYQFSGVEGTQIRAEVMGENLALALIDPLAATTLAEGSPLNVTLPITGRYVLRLQLLAGSTGSYVLTLVDATPPTATAIPPTPVPTVDPFVELGTAQGILSSAQPAFGALNSANENHLYTFQGAAGSYVRIRMNRTSGTIDPVLTLYDPDGNAIAVDDNSGGGRTALLNNVRLPRDGVYGVIAYGDGFSGTYDIALETALDPYPVTPVTDFGSAVSTPTRQPVILTPTVDFATVGNRLVDHVVYTGVMERAGTVHRYPIQVAAGELITISVTPGEGLRVNLELLSPSGAVIAQENQIDVNGEVIIPTLAIEQGDPHVLFVTAINNTSGSYQVSYGRGVTRAEVRRGEIFAERTYEVGVVRRATRDVWYLRLNLGDMITATAESRDGQFDPVLEIVDPNGEVLITDDNGAGGLSARIQSIRATTAGLYQLRVSPTTPDMLGIYGLTWRYLSAAPSPTPPMLVADLFTVDDSLAAFEQIEYPFQGRIGERVLITVTGAPGMGLDTRVDLVGPDGTVVASDDDSGGNLNPRLLAPIPADGVYRVRISGYNDSAGPFVLTVKRVY